jgi:hypothetical protein
MVIVRHPRQQHFERASQLGMFGIRDFWHNGELVGRASPNLEEPALLVGNELTQQAEDVSDTFGAPIGGLERARYVGQSTDKWAHAGE